MGGSPSVALDPQVQYRAPPDERTFAAVIQKAAKIAPSEAEAVAERFLSEARQRGVRRGPRDTVSIAITVAVFALAAVGLGALVALSVLLVGWR